MVVASEAGEEEADQLMELWFVGGEHRSGRRLGEGAGLEGEPKGAEEGRGTEARGGEEEGARELHWTEPSCMPTPLAVGSSLCGIVMQQHPSNYEGNNRTNGG